MILVLGYFVVIQGIGDWKGPRMKNRLLMRAVTQKNMNSERLFREGINTIQNYELQRTFKVKSDLDCSNKTICEL